jgi:hypothetical protein
MTLPLAQALFSSISPARYRKQVDWVLVVGLSYFQPEPSLWRRLAFYVQCGCRADTHLVQSCYLGVHGIHRGSESLTPKSPC